MRFFRRAKKKDGWLAIAVQRDGMAATSIRQGDGKPVVRCAVFLAGQPDVDTLEKAGREVQANQFRCATLLGGGEYQLITVEAPNVPKEEMRTAIRWRLKDILDFPVDEATVDLLEIPLDAAAHGRAQQSVFAIAARNSVIAPRQKLFLDARIDLGVIDIPEMAQRNISAMLEPEGRGIAMLSFGFDGALLTVSYRGELYLSRRFDVTLEQLLEADHERKHATFDRITLELQRSLDHFERQFSFVSVSKLLLAPSEVSGLDDYLSSNMYLPVETLDLASIFDFTRTPALLDKAAQQRFFLPLGAALRSGEAA